MSNANQTSKKDMRRRTVGQGTLTPGIGPVGRIDTSVGCSSAKAASKIKAAHGSVMKKPGNHLLFTPPGIADRRALIAVRIVDLSQYHYGERTDPPSTQADYGVARNV